MRTRPTIKGGWAVTREINFSNWHCLMMGLPFSFFFNRRENVGLFSFYSNNKRLPFSFLFTTVARVTTATRTRKRNSNLKKGGEKNGNHHETMYRIPLLTFRWRTISFASCLADILAQSVVVLSHPEFYFVVFFYPLKENVGRLFGVCLAHKLTLEYFYLLDMFQLKKEKKKMSSTGWCSFRSSKSFDNL